MKVMLITLPGEGQTKDYTTPTFLLTRIVRYMPLGILSVAAGISARHDIKILDASSLDLSINQTLEEIEVYEPDVLGISAVTRKTYAMSEILQKSKVPFKVVGGPHVTHYAKETISLGAHAIFLHDGDRNFGAWLNNNPRGGIFNDHIGNINELPLPRRELLNIEDYAILERDASSTLFRKSGVRLQMLSSRGCPFKCVFCDVQGKQFRYREPVKVVDEMEHLLSMGANSIHILDDCFNVKRYRVLEMCREIKKRGLQFEWSARGRPDIDKEIAGELSEAGCRRLHVGIESLDQNVLHWMDKHIEVERIKNFCTNCREYGIDILAYFIIGTPLETREYRKQLPEMVHELGIKFPYFNILYPASHTEYYYSLLKDGTFKKDYWDEFAKKPTPDFDLPLPRSPELQAELEETIADYINEFYGNEVPEEE